MKRVFADTAYWIALLNRRDSLHLNAYRLQSDLIDSEIVTSEMVLTEFLNHFSRGASGFRIAASTLVDDIYGDPKCRVVPQSAPQFKRALALYRQRADKEWSLTDCASILIMEAEGIHEVLSHDVHFVQAGFNALLRRSAS